jgi:hypothetical protein
LTGALVPGALALLLSPEWQKTAAQTKTKLPKALKYFSRREWFFQTSGFAYLSF